MVGAALEDLEGAAAWLVDGAGLQPPVSAFAAAVALGLRLRPCRMRGAALAGDVVLFDAYSRAVRQHGLVAHEVGHVVSQEAGVGDTEENANFVGSAVMLPRAPFERDLRTTGWDLRELRAKHLNVSAEMIARRIVSVRDAIATILDNGRVKARVVSPWLAEGFRRVSAFERELAATALETGEVQRPDGLIWAVPVFDGEHRRVIVVAEAEQLALRI